MAELIKEEQQQQAFNGNTLEWQGRKLKDMHSKELIDIIVHFFEMNLDMQAKIKKQEDINRIIQPYGN